MQFCRTSLGNCYGLKLPNCWLQLKNKFIVSFIIIIGTLSSPTARCARTAWWLCVCRWCTAATWTPCRTCGPCATTSTPRYARSSCPGSTRPPCRCWSSWASAVPSLASQCPDLSCSATSSSWSTREPSTTSRPRRPDAALKYVEVRLHFAAACTCRRLYNRLYNWLYNRL